MSPSNPWPPPPFYEYRKPIASAHERFRSHNPKSLAAHDASCAHLPGGNTRTVLHSSPCPLTFASGSAQHLTDLDGHEYIDFLGEYTAGIYGHSNPTIREAVQRVMSTGWNLGGHSQHEKRLAEMVCERFQLDLVRFTNSGTEANMLALATATTWTGGRHKVLVFEGGYHGSTLSFKKGSEHINLPYEWVVGAYNDVSATETLVTGLPENSLAAILVEPMLGSGGAIPSTQEFLQYLRKVSHDLGALLLFDEVMTSRLDYHALGNKMGVRADLITLGKWIGGGMSFGAFGGRKDIMSLYDPSKRQLAHAGTFNNNVVSMAAGVAGCSILTDKKLYALNKMGDLMRQKITEQLVANGYGEPPKNKADPKEHCMWVSGIGSIMAIHFSGAYQDAMLELFFHQMLKQGIYLAPRGFIALSIEITESDVAKFLQAMEKFVKFYASERGPRLNHNLEPPIPPALDDEVVLRKEKNRRECEDPIKKCEAVTERLRSERDAIRVEEINKFGQAEEAERDGHTKAFEQMEGDQVLSKDLKLVEAEQEELDGAFIVVQSLEYQYVAVG